MPRAKNIAPSAKGHLNELTLRLDGVLITPEDFRKAATAFTELLLQVTEQIALGGKKPLWNISVREGSSVFVARPVADVETEKPARETIRVLRSGLGLLERGQSEVPNFTQKAMLAARSLGELKSRTNRPGISVVEIGNGDGKTHSITSKTVDVVKKNVGAQHHAYGSIEGKLSTISERGAFQFVVFDALTDRGVNCFVRQNQFRDAHAAFGKRVNVSGVIQYDRNSKPLSIDVVQIRVFRSNQEIGPIDQFCGILAESPA